MIYFGEFIEFFFFSILCSVCFFLNILFSFTEELAKEAEDHEFKDVENYLRDPVPDIDPQTQSLG